MAIRRDKNQEKLSKSSRFIGTEKRLINALKKSIKKHRSLGLKACYVTTENHIPSSTFYDHYSDMTDFEVKNEKILVREFRKELSRFENVNFTLYELFQCSLIFWWKKREYVSLFLSTKNLTTPAILVDELKPFLRKRWNDYGEKNNLEMWRIFRFLVFAELANWAEENFDDETLATHAKNLEYKFISIPKFYAKLMK